MSCPLASNGYIILFRCCGYADIRDLGTKKSTFTAKAVIHKRLLITALFEQLTFRDRAFESWENAVAIKVKNYLISWAENFNLSVPLNRLENKMNLLIRNIFISIIFFTSGCVGPLVQEIEVDPSITQKLKSEIKVVTTSDLKGKNFKSLGMISATSCFNNFITDKTSSSEDALDQLRYKASTLGGNAILNPSCQSEGTSLAKNCWTSTTCTAGAIVIGGITRNENSEEYTSGTCFVVSPNGFIITNAHVVEGAKDINVNLTSGVSHIGTVQSISRTTDIALIKIDDENLDYIPLASSQMVNTGTKVFTMGFPATQILGNEPKYTDGSISSLTGVGGESTLMQTTVPIQPGNSGGPLVTEDGYAVGIMTSTAAVNNFYRITGSLPQNINWAVKSEYASLLFRAPKNLESTTNRSEAIERTKKALCKLEATR